MLTETSLLVDAHAMGLLPIDPESGSPVPLDYGYTTERTADAADHVSTVGVPLGDAELPETARAHLMVDTYPAARGDVRLRPAAGP